MTDAQRKAIAAVEGAFGRLVKDATIQGKWITWKSIHKTSALVAKVRAAEDAGARGVFVRPEGRVGGSCVGCLNPDHDESGW